MVNWSLAFCARSHWGHLLVPWPMLCSWKWALKLQVFNLPIEKSGFPMDTPSPTLQPPWQVCKGCVGVTICWFELPAQRNTMEHLHSFRQITLQFSTHNQHQVYMYPVYHCISQLALIANFLLLWLVNLTIGFDKRMHSLCQLVTLFLPSSPLSHYFYQEMQPCN